MNGLTVVLASAGGAALIKLIDGVVQWCLQRHGKALDNKEVKRDNLEVTIKCLRTGMMVIMLDRIQYLCKAYIRDKEVDFDDRRRLHIMHDTYHNALGGNGDLDILMSNVDKLPLKQ